MSAAAKNDVFTAASLAGLLAVWYVLTPEAKKISPLVMAFILIPGSSLLLPLAVV